MLCAACLLCFCLTQIPILYRETRAGWISRQSRSRRPLTLSSKLPWSQAGAQAHLPTLPWPPPSAQHPVVHETKMDRILLCFFSRGVGAQVLTRTPFPPAFPHSPSSCYSRHTGLVLSWNLPGTLPCFSVTALAVPSGCSALPSPPSSLQAKVTSSTKPALITQFKIVTPRHSQPRLYLALCLPLPSTSLSA